MKTGLRSIIRELITPDDIMQSIYQITPAYLKKHKIGGIILDLDNTLLPRTEKEPSLRCLAWIEDIKACGVKLFIATNNTNASRVIKASNYLDIPAVYKCMKPFTLIVNKIIKEVFFLRPDNTMIVGDQFFSDIICGNWLGLRTVFVQPLEQESTSFRRRLIEIDKKVHTFFANN